MRKIYDAIWAINVLSAYEKLWPRAEQINRCIAQVYHETTGRNCTSVDIRRVLLESIRNETSGRIWRDYKTLVKKSPLKKELLLKLVANIRPEVDVEKLQRQFEFT